MWPKSGHLCRILAVLARFRQRSLASESDKREPSAVDLGYQQTQCPSGGGFLQTCLQ
jgi:hypothetical protein